MQRIVEILTLQTQKNVVITKENDVYLISVTTLENQNQIIF